MPTFNSTNPMEHLEADEYFLEKIQKLEEKQRRKRVISSIEKLNYRHNIIKALRKKERQNKKGGRK